ncbi:DUF3299 domain-containing protein [Pontibacter sp. G13]|uniref:DUF3299 domain-containing protein n=1 Tax=Pontibacter sp. G13 TaxID=3074898 RepID=UPI00288B1FF6|nr:DUF3299 domain-containing protein [Pontibacter sp. G13]WNJ20601.1 DUF3299 domain-containing protein [Pontibacter sp. G13]
MAIQLKSVILLGFMILGIVIPSMGQEKLTWTLLEQVRFGGDTWNPQAVSAPPTFPEELLALEGKRVRIRGYMLPIDVEGSVFALSANPYSACFFCGAAGIESVISLELANHRRKYEMDEYVHIEGILKLNSRPDELIYQLDQVREVD